MMCDMRCHVVTCGWMRRFLGVQVLGEHPCCSWCRVWPLLQDLPHDEQGRRWHDRRRPADHLVRPPSTFCSPPSLIYATTHPPLVLAAAFQRPVAACRVMSSHLPVHVTPRHVVRRRSHSRTHTQVDGGHDNHNRRHPLSRVEHCGSSASLWLQVQLRRAVRRAVQGDAGHVDGVGREDQRSRSQAAQLGFVTLRRVTHCGGAFASEHPVLTVWCVRGCVCP
jgi:hypothetical protein